MRASRWTGSPRVSIATLFVLLAALPWTASCARTTPQPHFDDATIPCLPSTTSATLNALYLDGGRGTAVSLCPFAVVTIDPRAGPIRFTAPYQSLYTSGLPTDDSRATIKIHGPHSDKLATAVKADCNDCGGVVVQNLIVDGGRMELNGVEGGDALILVGGEMGAQEIRQVEAFGARGYAVVHASGTSGAGSPLE